MERRTREPAQAETAPAEPAGVPVAVPATAFGIAAHKVTPAQVLALQRGPGNAAVGRLLQRQHVDHFSGRPVGNSPSPHANVREDVLDVMDRLMHLWSIPAGSATAAERAAVAAAPAGGNIPVATIPLTIAALKQNEGGHLAKDVIAKTFGIASATGPVGQGQVNSRPDVLAVITLLNANWYVSNGDAAAESAAVKGHAADQIPDGLIPATIAGIARAKKEYVAGKWRLQDLMKGTHAVTAAQHAAVEGILNPGATVTSSTSGGVTTTTTTMPPMVGGGPGGQYETKMFAQLKAQLGPRAADLKTRQATHVEGFPIAKAKDIAAAAQEQVESYFAPYIKAASRQASDLYHPGAFDLASVLGDQSKRPLGPDDLVLWMDYFMTSTSMGTQPIHNAHHPDTAEFARVRDKFIHDNPAMVTDAIHSWPAEAATGTVFINPWRDPAAGKQRTTRWDIFTTLIHEMMHKVTHPNFMETSELLEDRAGKILREGMADVMRHELWDGPGNLKGRLASMPDLCERVEGKKMPYDPTQVVYHTDYPEIGEARQIVAQVGMENAKAAFFLGRIDLLGLGDGTHTKGGASLSGKAEWKPTDEGDASVYVAQAGDTLQTVRQKTNAPDNGVLDATGKALATGAAVNAGDRLTVPGIRWVRAIDGDTFASVARQSGVDVGELAEANGFSPSIAGTAPLPVGKRMLIPLHRVI